MVGPQVIGKSRVEKKEGAPENHCKWWVSVGVDSIKGNGHPGDDNDKKPTDSAEGEVDRYVCTKCAQFWGPVQVKKKG